MKFKKLRKLLSLCLVLALFTSTNALAATENFNVSTTKPTEYNNDGIVVFGTNKPSTKWDLSTQGQYDFSGSAEVSKLYTSVKFTKNSADGITLVVRNHSSSTLTVKVIKDSILDSTIETYTISGNSTDIFVLSPETIIPGKYYFLSFSAPSNFSGYLY